MTRLVPLSSVAQALVGADGNRWIPQAQYISVEVCHPRPRAHCTCESVESVESGGGYSRGPAMVAATVPGHHIASPICGRILMWSRGSTGSTGSTGRPRVWGQTNRQTTVLAYHSSLPPPRPPRDIHDLEPSDQNSQRSHRRPCAPLLFSLSLSLSRSTLYPRHTF